VSALALASTWRVAGFVSLAPPHAQSSPDRAAATIGTWVSIGPAPLVYADDPSAAEFFNSGRVAAVAVDPGAATHWLIGVGNGGVWETRDAGASWAAIAEDAPTLAIGAVAFAPSNPRVIYVGTGESAAVGFAKAGVGLLKSTDGGVSWSLLGATSFARATVKRLRVHPTTEDVVLAATARGGFGRESYEGAPAPPPFGILRSQDGGATWARTLAGHATALEIDASNFSNQYAAIADQRVGVLNDSPGSVPNGLYRSTDAGLTWSPVSGPWGPNPSPTMSSVGRIELALSPSNPNVLYAAIQVPPNGGSTSTGLLGLFRTDNAWAPMPAWIQVSTTATPPGGYCNPKCGYSHVISVDPANPDTLFAGGAERGLWRCTRCGAAPTWTNVTRWVPLHTDHHAMTWAGNRLIVGTDGGVWSSPDTGATWQNHNTGLSTAMFYGGALHPTNRDVLLGGLRDFQVSLRNGHYRWVITPQPATGEWGEAEVALSSRNPDTHWMAGWLWGDIQRTTDGGRTVARADAGIDKIGAAFVAPVKKCPSNDDVFVTGTNRLWRTNDFFNSTAPTWFQNSPAHPYPIPTALRAPGTVLSIAYAPSDTSCNTYAYGNRGGELSLTQNGGGTWANLDPGRTLPARPINGLAFHPASPATLYAALSSFDNGTPGKPGHIFKTTNAQAPSPTWVDISPPADVPFNVIAIDPRNPARVYAGADTGLWQSDDGGATWVKKGVSDGMPNAPVYDIQINAATDQTVVFTYGRGAYRLVTAVTSVHPPTDFRVVSITGHTVTVEFDPPADSLPPTGYVLEGGVTPGQVLASLPIAASATRATFDAPAGAFYIRLHSLSGGLRSIASNEIRIFVEVPAPPSAPTNLLALVNGSTVSLAWMNTAWGGAPTVSVLVVSEPFSLSVGLPLTESVTVPGVPPGTYTVFVRANNASGGTTSPSSVRFTVPGTCTPPGTPAAFTTTKTGNRIDLSWALPTRGAAPTGFVVNVTGTFTASFPVAGRGLGGNVGPGTYIISVVATNPCGSSPPTAPRTVTVP
jgi:photosystem II stability/assembly factor-like uncharacterized protein